MSGNKKYKWFARAGDVICAGPYDSQYEAYYKNRLASSTEECWRFAENMLVWPEFVEEETKFDNSPNKTPEGWHRHSNGGGLVQDTAFVAETAYVGPYAKVCNYAKVYGYAITGENTTTYKKVNKITDPFDELEELDGGCE